MREYRYAQASEYTLMHTIPASPTSDPARRLQRIAVARQTVLVERRELTTLQSGVEDWIERSWLRCLNQGQRPGDAVTFDAVSREAMLRAVDSSRPLVNAARPVLGQLAHAMARTRYFAILTNAQGLVVDVNGPVDRSDRRATSITRLGVDLSERAVGTTAISAALGEQHAVWLHRGEHFFADTSVYSCAGAPVFGPLGHCVGMLDLTGVDVPERPELKHLVALCAQRIENALLHQQNFALQVRLRWPSDGLTGMTGSESDGLISLDAEGFVIGSNTAARQMLPATLPSPLPQAPQPVHCSDLFAMPWETFFDAALLGTPAVEVPLWSGLRLQAFPRPAGQVNPTGAETSAPARRSASLRDVETALIRKAVDEAKGNVAQAARVLGISRATVYRKLERGAQQGAAGAGHTKRSASPR